MSLRRWAPAIAGVTGIAASTIAADVWASRTERPTISAAGGRLLEHQVAGAVYAGCLCALGYHLLAEPIIRRIEAGRR